MAKPKKKSEASDAVRAVENTGHETPPPGPDLAPVLELIHCASAGTLDACQEEIVRQETDRYPLMAVPSPASIDQWVSTARRAVAS